MSSIEDAKSMGSREEVQILLQQAGASASGEDAAFWLCKQCLRDGTPGSWRPCSEIHCDTTGMSLCDSLGGRCLICAVPLPGSWMLVGTQFEVSGAAAGWSCYQRPCNVSCAGNYWEAGNQGPCGLRSNSHYDRSGRLDAFLLITKSFWPSERSAVLLQAGAATRGQSTALWVRRQLLGDGRPGAVRALQRDPL